MKRFVVTIVSAITLLAAVTAWALPAPVYADAKGDVCSGIGGCSENTGPSVDKVITTAVTIISIIAGVAAVIMVIVSGLRFITAGGDAGKVASARGALIYALIGIVVAGSAQFIVKFVLARTL